MIERAASSIKTPAPSSLRRHLPSLFLGLAVSVIAIWLIVRGVNLDETLTILVASHWQWVALAFIAQMIATAFTLRRWQVMLQPYPTQFFRLTQVYFIAHLLNTVLPAKIGTVARVALAAETERLNGGFVFGSIAAEKILDTWVMLVLFVLIAAWVPLPAWLREPLALSALVALVGVVAVLALRGLRARILSAVGSIERRVFGTDGHRLTALVNGVVENLVRLTGRREAAEVLIWTALMWITAGLANLLLFLALDIRVEWSAMWFLLIVLQIGTRVPALPANLGVFHYLVILTLSLYGVAEARALGFALLLHLIVFILPAFIGAGFSLPMIARVSELVWKGLHGRLASEQL